MKQFYRILLRAGVSSLLLPLLAGTVMNAVAGEQVRTVSGHVALKANGMPVAATVEFATIDDRGLFDPDEPHCTGPGMAAPDGRQRFRVSTDKEGKYEIQLPDGQSFLVRATSEPNFLTGELLPDYYPGTSNPMESSVITVMQDRKDLNFALNAMPVYNNGFSGTILGADGKSQGATVYAQLVSPNASHYGWNMRVRSVLSDALTGKFTLSNLVPGEYVVQIVAGPPGTLPEYYKEKTKSVLNWAEGTRITVGETMTSEALTAQLADVAGTHGWSEVSGIITKGVPGTTSFLALSGAAVFALDANGYVSDYAISDAYGKFSLKKVGLGTSTVVVDKIGYARQTSTVHIDKDGVVPPLNVAMRQQTPTGVTEETAAVTDVLAYPNPAHAAVTIRFSGKAGMTRIALVNMLGMEMLSTQTQTVEGMNLQTLSTKSLAPGMYFVRINGKTLPLTIR